MLSPGREGVCGPSTVHEEEPLSLPVPLPKKYRLIFHSNDWGTKNYLVPGMKYGAGEKTPETLVPCSPRPSAGYVRTCTDPGVATITEIRHRTNQFQRTLGGQQPGYGQCVRTHVCMYCMYVEVHPYVLDCVLAPFVCAQRGDDGVVVASPSSYYVLYVSSSYLRYLYIFS